MAARRRGTAALGRRWAVAVGFGRAPAHVVPALASSRARFASAGSTSPNRSGAPSTSRSSPRSSALQRRREENGTWPTTRRWLAVREVRIRDRVERQVARRGTGGVCRQRTGERTPRPRRRRARSQRLAASARSACPVLSVQTRSTEASDSIALSCCASTPRWAILNADTAAVTLISRISPSGTRLTIPAVMACTRVAAVPLRANTDDRQPNRQRDR